MRQPLGTLLLAAAILLLAPPLLAEDSMLLERVSGFTEAPETCDLFHHKKSCDDYHFTKTPPKVSTWSVGSAPSRTEVGSVIYLNGQPYQLDWVGNGYYLDNGSVLHAQTGLNGTEWVEVYPEEGRIHHGATLQDSNLDGAAGISDLLDLGRGVSAQIVDVRLNVRVSVTN